MSNVRDFVTQLGEGVIYIFWQSLGGFIYFWPISTVLLGLLVLSLVLHWPLRDIVHRRHFKWALLSFLPPLLVAVVGATFPYGGPPQERGTAPTGAIELVYGLLAIHIGLAIAILVRSPRSRWQLTPLLVTSLFWEVWVVFAAVVVIIGVGP